jgi:hypothetical protein
MQLENLALKTKKLPPQYEKQHQKKKKKKKGKKRNLQNLRSPFKMKSNPSRIAVVLSKSP